MGFWDKLNKFAVDINNTAKKLEKKTAELVDHSAEYCENERIKGFYKIKEELIILNEKQRKVGIKETTIFDFFKDRPDYQDLLDKEKNLH